MSEYATRSKTLTIASRLLRLLAAAILVQTLYFKFTAAPESVYIFTTLGMEPWGRIGTGMAELIASMLLLFPATVTIGAVLSAGLMTGAVAAHLGRLGVSVMGDGGQLFFLALTVLAASLLVLAIHRREIPLVGRLFQRV